MRSLFSRKSKAAKTPYATGGYITAPDNVWSPSHYERLGDLQEMSYAVETALFVEEPKAVTRCDGCHSSEFDSKGRCSYCRQYRK